MHKGERGYTRLTQYLLVLLLMVIDGYICVLVSLILEREREIDREREADRPTDRQTDRQTDRCKLPSAVVK